jgi:Fur family ferric uptake transcriptional regulator
MMDTVRKRMTRQRAAVHEALQGDASHPSADEIYLRVRKVLPRISLGTVYRNLQQLVEEGRIRVLLLDERVARYDPMLADHDHFICQRCNRVIDVMLEYDRDVNTTPLVEQGFTITAHRLSVHGLCQTCARQPRS